MEDSSFLKVTILAEFIRPTTLPAHSSNLNAFAERWMKSIKDDCLSKLTLFGKTSLRCGLREYLLAQLRGFALDFAGGKIFLPYESVPGLWITTENRL